jgi:hypothetical protein
LPERDAAAGRHLTDKWGPGFNAQNKMLDEHSKKYNLQEMDWRKQKPWYKPTK